MNTVAILEMPSSDDNSAFRAVSGKRFSEGRTAGEALDAIETQLIGDESTTVVLLQRRRPDVLFNQEQQQRLEGLMEKWRVARDNGKSLNSAEAEELKELIDGELAAATTRAKVIADEMD